MNVVKLAQMTQIMDQRINFAVEVKGLTETVYFRLSVSLARNWKLHEA